MSATTVLIPELRKIACEELNEDENRMSKDIEALRCWIEMQPHLNARTDDRFLLTFLRGTKYSLEKAKRKLEYFYTIRPMLPEVFKNIAMDEKTLAICRLNTYLRLPNPFGVDGPRMHLTIIDNFDFNKYTVPDLLRYESMLFESSIFNDDNYAIAGYIEIFDATNAGMKLAPHADFVLLKKLIFLIEKALPIRVKGVHLVNFTKEMYPLMQLAKSLMPKKLQSRVHIYKNMKELYKCIPQSYFPHEYGGKNGKISEIQAETEKFLMQHDFENDNKFGFNEKYREIKLINANELFGIEGSFRKLDID